MEMKDLNQSQLIMLAVLLSFVTSIATGIVTVSLMQQAPISISAPINRVVRETVEKIVPGSTNKTQTIVVKEEDLVVDAIAKNKSAVFAISKDGFDLDGKTIEVPAGRGFVISSDGIVVVDATLVPDKENYYVKNDSGTFKAEFISTDKSGLSLLKIGAPVDGKSKIAFTLPVFGDLNKMKAGQKIITLGSTISSFMFEGSKDIKISVLKANAGSLVLNLDGEALGIALSGDTNSFVAIDAILATLKK